LTVLHAVLSFKSIALFSTEEKQAQSLADKWRKNEQTNERTNERIDRPLLQRRYKYWDKIVTFTAAGLPTWRARAPSLAFVTTSSTTLPDCTQRQTDTLMPRQPRVTSGDVLLADPAAGGSKGQYYTAPADLWENAVGRSHRRATLRRSMATR